MHNTYIYIYLYLYLYGFKRRKQTSPCLEEDMKEEKWSLSLYLFFWKLGFWFGSSCWCSSFSLDLERIFSSLYLLNFVNFGRLFYFYFFLGFNLNVFEIKEEKKPKNRGSFKNGSYVSASQCGSACLYTSGERA